MPTLAQVRTRVDSWLTNAWGTIRTRQDAYYAAHGRYWQGKWSHVATPSHDAATDGDTAPDALADSPTDQAETWMDMFSEFSGSPIAARIRIDVYDGPQGDGFEGTVQVKYDGTIYERSQNYGPETWRTQAWHVVEPDAVG